MRIQNKNLEIEADPCEGDDGEIGVDFYNKENSYPAGSPQMMATLWSFSNPEDEKSLKELIDFLIDKEKEFGMQYYTEVLDREYKYRLIHGELKIIGRD